MGILACAKSAASALIVVTVDTDFGDCEATMDGTSRKDLKSVVEKELVDWEATMDGTSREGLCSVRSRVP